jgi:APA family basic amino acid/polyamine antiporter
LTTPKHEPELARGIGLSTATALIVAEVIGVGIFLTPARMAHDLASPFWLFFVWLAAGLSAIGGALCFGALAARYPQAGGSYIYLNEAYGPRAAFLYGWLSLLVTDPGITALLAVGTAEYVGYLVPLSDWGAKAVAAAAIALAAAINILGISLTSGILRTLAALKIGLLAFLVVWGFGLGLGDWSNLLPFWTRPAEAQPLPGALIGAAIAAFFSFGGWWDVSKLAGEMRDPGRTLPRALILGVSIVTVVYVAVSVVLLYLIAPARLSADTAFAAMAGEALFGPRGGTIFTAIVILSVLGSLCAVLMASPRVYYAMGRDRLFFAELAAVHPRFGTPARAIAIQAILAIVLTVSGKFQQILDYFMVPTILFLALTIIGIFLLRRRTLKRSEIPLAIPGYPLSPLLFLLPVLALIILMTLGKPWETSIGLLVVVAGLPVSLFLIPRVNRPKDASLPIEPAHLDPRSTESFS